MPSPSLDNVPQAMMGLAVAAGGAAMSGPQSKKTKKETIAEAADVDTETADVDTETADVETETADVETVEPTEAQDE